MSRLIPNQTDIFRKVDTVIESVNAVLGRVDGTLGSVNVTLADATTVLADVRDLLVDLRGELTLVGTLPAITTQLDEVHHPRRRPPGPRPCPRPADADVEAFPKNQDANGDAPEMMNAEPGRSERRLVVCGYAVAVMA